jgi:hypothetical protein
MLERDAALEVLGPTFVAAACPHPGRPGAESAFDEPSRRELLLPAQQIGCVVETKAAVRELIGSPAGDFRPDATVLAEERAPIDEYWAARRNIIYNCFLRIQNTFSN